MREYSCLLTAVNTVVRCAAMWRARRRFLRVRTAAVMLQAYARKWSQKRRFDALKKAALTIQKNVKMWQAQKSFRTMVHAVLILQYYARKFIAKRKQENSVSASAIVSLPKASPDSMSSSLTSFGYQTASASLHSINSMTQATSPAFNNIASLSDTLANWSLPRYSYRQNVHPSTRRLLETEESGIETDTESLSGDREHADFEDQARVRKRRAKLQLLLPSISFNAEEALLSSDTQDERNAKQNAEHYIKNSPERWNNDPNSPRLSLDQLDASLRRCGYRYCSMDSVPTNITVRRKKRKSSSYSVDNPNMVRINSSHQMKSVLEMFATKPEIEFMYSSNRGDFFFREGIVSRRRIPTVCITGRILFIYFVGPNTYYVAKLSVVSSQFHHAHVSFHHHSHLYYQLVHHHQSLLSFNYVSYHYITHL